MGVPILSYLIQGSPEWHDWRLSGVGASEVPSLMGTDPYGGTPKKLWLVKTKRSKGFEGNSATQHGKETEAKARARYELINLEDMPDACATHPKYRQCICSLDGIRTDYKLILEIKCPIGCETIDLAIANRMPPHYYDQVQYQLAITGADIAHFFVYHESSGRSAMVELQPDLQRQGEIIAAVLDFWERYVLTDTPPPLMDEDVKVIEDDPIVEAICDLILDSKKTKATKKQMDALKAEAIKLANHPKMICGRVQISTVNRNGVFSYHKLTIKDEGIAS